MTESENTITERQKYAELAVKANAENKIIHQHENGEYELIDQQTFNTCSFVNGAWVEDIDKKLAYEEAKRKLEVPASLSRFQAVRVLKSFKIDNTNLYKLTDSYIKSLNTDIEENDEIADAWELAQEFKRDSLTILAAQKQFELTDDQVDMMFIEGSKITA